MEPSNRTSVQRVPNFQVGFRQSSVGLQCVELYKIGQICTHKFKQYYIIVHVHGSFPLWNFTYNVKYDLELILYNRKMNI